MNELEQIRSQLNTIETLLKQQKSVFTVTEAAAYLNITVSTLYKYSAASLIPYSKPAGRIIYFSREDLDRWMLGSKSMSDDAKESIASNHVTVHK